MSTDLSPGTQSSPAPRATSGLRSAWAGTRRWRPVLLLVAVLVLYFSVSQPHFSSLSNIQNMLTSVGALWVVAMGMTFVLIAGAIDLSVGAVAAFCGVFFAHMITSWSVPGPLALLLAVTAGIVIGGLVNGGLIGPGKLSFFVVTLGLMTGLTGVVQIWTDTNSIPVSSATTDFLAAGALAGISIPIVLMIVSFTLALYLQRFTYAGRDIFAVGGSKTAAELAGVRTSRTIISVFALVGGCAALAGCMTVARIGAATPQVDATLPLQAIAAVLLGGTSIFGGAGGVGGTAMGVLFIGTLQNGLSIAGVQNYWQLVITGIILIAAVAGDRAGLASFFRRRPPRSVPSQPEPTAAVVATPHSSAPLVPVGGEGRPKMSGPFRPHSGSVRSTHTNGEVS